MPIEVIPRQKIKPKLKISLIDILYYLLIFFLVLTILGYFGLEYYKSKLEKELEGVKMEIIQKKTPETKRLEEEIATKKRKIDIFSDLIKEHQRKSRFFKFLEGICHKKIFFSGIKLDSEKLEAKISGRAENFRTLGEQFLLFEKEELIKDFSLSAISIGEKGGVEFEVLISLDPKVFK